MGKLTISMAIFKSYVSLPEGILKKGTKMRGNPKISWEMGTIKQKSHGISWGSPADDLHFRSSLRGHGVEYGR